MLESPRPGATLHLVNIDGSEVGHVSTVGVYVGDERASRLFFSDGKRLQAVTRSGRASVLSTFAPPESAVVIDPSGERWLWAVEEPSAGSDLRSQIFLAGQGASPRLVTTHVENEHYLVPVRWTAQGVIVQHLPTGIGGVSAFTDAFVFATSRFNVDTGAMTPLTPETCHLSTVADDGTVVCVVSPQSIQQRPVVRFISSTGQRRDVSIPGDVVEAGHVVFAPSGSLVAVGAARARGNTEAVPFSYMTFLIDTRTGKVRRLGPDGLQPIAWLDAARLLASRRDSTGGDPGTYIVSANGSATQISGYSGAIAVVQ
ncbi:MAG TPA: hypothetical protein VE219_06865 [Candidatus Sulfotelmatobacter sp.]|nr:hypothetical protein [Candidatus Sulfotelmatobacter sp.]